MKRFALIAFVASALAAPAVAVASQNGFVYRPELRQYVPVPPEPGKEAITRSLDEEIARHVQMAHGYRGTRMAQAAVHCDRLVSQLREARAKN